MKTTHGSFTVEGVGAEPWTENDERRLRGGWPHPLTPRHVMTSSGPFVIGTMRLDVKAADALAAGKRALAERHREVAAWAHERGIGDAERFYLDRAAALEREAEGGT